MMKDYSEMNLEELYYVLPYVEGERVHGYHSDEDVELIYKRIRLLEAEKAENEKPVK